MPVLEKIGLLTRVKNLDTVSIAEPQKYLRWVSDFKNNLVEYTITIRSNLISLKTRARKRYQSDDGFYFESGLENAEISAIK